MGGWEWVILVIAPLFYFGGQRLQGAVEPGSELHLALADVPVEPAGGGQISTLLERGAGKLLLFLAGAATPLILAQFLTSTLAAIVFVLVMVLVAGFAARLIRRDPSAGGAPLWAKILAVVCQVLYISLTIWLGIGGTSDAEDPSVMLLSLLALVLATAAATLLLWPILSGTVSRRDTLFGIASLVAGAHLLIMAIASVADGIPLGIFAFVVGSVAALLLGSGILLPARKAQAAACVSGGLSLFLAGVELAQRNAMVLVGCAFFIVTVGMAQVGFAERLSRSKSPRLRAPGLAVAGIGTALLSSESFLLGGGWFGLAFLATSLGLILLAIATAIRPGAGDIWPRRNAFRLAAIGLAFACVGAVVERWAGLAIACLVVATAIVIESLNLSVIRERAIRTWRRLNARTPSPPLR